MLRLIQLLIITISFSSSVALAEDWSSVPAKKQTKAKLYMTPAQAYEHMNKQGNSSLFIDVRTRAEVNFLGTPTVADANVPYMELNEWYAWNEKKNSFKLEVNSDFADSIGKRLAAKQLGKDDTIILICRSGSRSAKAADLLTSLGYTKVYSIVEGYEGDKAKTGNKKGQRVVNGWKNTDLPWTYQLVKNKMYINADLL